MLRSRTAVSVPGTDSHEDDVLRALRKAQQRRRLKDAENARIARLMREADRFHGGWPAPPSREARS